MYTVLLGTLGAVTCTRVCTCSWVPEYIFDARVFCYQVVDDDDGEDGDNDDDDDDDAESEEEDITVQSKSGALKSAIAGRKKLSAAAGQIKVTRSNFFNDIT